PIHRWAGRVFRYSAMVVLGAAGIAVMLNAVRALFVHRLSIADNPEQWAFLLFLGYLALVTGVMLSHGIAVLRSKQDLSKLHTPYRILSAWSAMVSSVLIIAFALFYRPDNAILLYALSPLGLLNGRGILKVIAQQATNGPREWLIEHLGALLGCGVAFHTAFAVFGMNHFLPVQLSGGWAVIPWILPTLIGVPASILWARKYRQQTIKPTAPAVG
ncbi:MAG: hypothetical protein AAGH65_06300, partial [Pseudomonadota bacterium]